MQNIGTLNSFFQLRYSFFRWRSSLGFMKKIALSLGMACIIGFTAQLKFYLPCTPVPIVCSTLGAVMAGIFLGRLWGGISVFLYILIGSMGMPWFAGFKGGTVVLLGPTAGYMIGFILSALLVGFFTDVFVNSRKMLPMFVIVLFAHIILMYVPGVIALGWWLSLCGKSFTFSQLLWMGALPFIPGDIVKSVIAAGIAKAVTPKQAYNNEIDRNKIWRVP